MEKCNAGNFKTFATFPKLLQSKSFFQVNIYLLKVKNRNTSKKVWNMLKVNNESIRSKIQWCRSGVVIVNIFHTFFYCFYCYFEEGNVSWGCG